LGNPTCLSFKIGGAKSEKTTLEDENEPPSSIKSTISDLG